MDTPSEPHTGWTFLTNHARVLSTIAHGQRTRVRDIAAHCLLTERAVQRIIADLEEGGYLTHTRQGRSNSYHVTAGTTLRHPADTGTVAELLALLADREPGSQGTTGNGSAPGGHAQSTSTDQPAGQ
jgi:hypothetical protein